MEKWKKELVICQYCAKKEENCDNSDVEMGTNRKGKSWKCFNYERADEKK